MGGYIILFGAGILLIIRGFLHVKEKISFKRACTVSVVARIVDVEEVINDTNERKKYVPVYEYIANGQLITCKNSSYESHTNEFQLGEQVHVKYNPEKPSEFYIGKISLVSKEDIFSSIIGTVMIVIAIAQM